MQRLAIGLMLVAVLGVVAPAHARTAGKTKAGAILTLSGSALVLAAFDYTGDQCPEGYSTHTYENLSTQCVFLSRSGSDVRTATTGITYKRPGLMWSGLGVAATGIVLLLLPERARMVDVSVTPDGWRASKMIGW